MTAVGQGIGQPDHPAQSQPEYKEKRPEGMGEKDSRFVLFVEIGQGQRLVDQIRPGRGQSHQPVIRIGGKIEMFLGQTQRCPGVGDVGLREHRK